MPTVDFTASTSVIIYKPVRWNGDIPDPMNRTR
jgi:hypothetical protein